MRNHNSSWLIAVLVVLVGWTATAPAQTLFSSDAGSPEVVVPTLPDPLTPEAATALISRLSDKEVRALLLERLNTAASPENDDTEVADFLYHATTGAFGAITSAIERLPILYSTQVRAFANFGNVVGANGLLKTASFLLLVIAGAFAIELVFRWAVSRWFVLPSNPDPSPTFRQSMYFLTARLASEILGVVVFVLAAMLLTQFLVPEYFRQFLGLIGLWLIALPRMAIAVGRFMMAPDNPPYRIVYATDQTAKAIVMHNFWFAIIIGIGVVLIPFNHANGVPPGESRIGFWINLSVHLYAAILAWRYRDAMVMMMRGSNPDVSPLEERMAQAYPFFAIAVALGTWWVVNIVVSYENFQMLGTAPHYKTLFLLFFAPAMDTAIRGLVRQLAHPMTGEGSVAERAYRASIRSYVRIGRVIVFGLVLLLIAGFWGMTPASIATAGVGERFAANLIEFLMILSVGYLVYEVVSLIINRRLAAEMTVAGADPESEEVGGEGGGAGGSRLSTVLPLVLGTSRVTIVVVFLLLALGNIGVDTTPLLAGAGIVGLAIGFGAQKLVTDVVSGIFFLIDDAFRTGEYVDVGGTMGTVEKISIRSMQLRHHTGPVHTLPYGEIPKITNFSRDWVIMKLRFTVPFGTDPNKVKKIFKKIGQEMLEVEPFKDDFLQPFKSQGVLEFDDVGMVIRGKFMARPGQQFTLRKEIYNRVNAAFKANGIEFARREVRVAIPGLDNTDKLGDDEKAAVAAAATQAAQQQAEEKIAAPKPGD